MTLVLIAIAITEKLQQHFNSHHHFHNYDKIKSIPVRRPCVGFQNYY
jgi:hypothetical protein